LTLLPLFPLDDFKAALKGRFSGTTLEKNIELADMAAEYTPKSLWQEVENA